MTIVTASAAPTNDDFANAVVIARLPLNDGRNTVGAMTESGEPLPCGAVGATVWYSFTPTSDMVIKADTFESDYDTVLAAYSGASLSNLTLLACNDDPLSFQGDILFEATAGRTIFLQVGSSSGTAGNLLLHVIGTAPPPPPHPSSCRPAQVGGAPGWTRKTPLPVGHEGTTGVIVGNRLYVTHGFSALSGETKDNFIYDIPTDTWFLGALAPSRSSELTGVCIEDQSGQGLVFAVGGRPARSNVEIYNPISDTWFAGPPMPTPRRGLGAAFVGGIGVAGGHLGSVFVVGGGDGVGPRSGTPLAVNEAFDVEVGVWIPRAPMRIPMMDIYSTTYFPGTERIYVFGGFDGLFESDALQIYDRATDTWSLGAPMPTPRSNLISGICGTRIYAIGGCDRLNNLGVNESYDPFTDTWLAGEPGKPHGASEMASQLIYTGAEIYGVGSGISGRSEQFNEVFTCGAVAPVCFSDVDCNDGNSCNGAETCDVMTGICLPGSPLDCDDGNPCTDDACGTATGCVHTNNAASCNDGNACTTGDICSGGVCTGTNICCAEPNPRTQGYYRRLCKGPLPADQITQADVECVNDSCTFASVTTIQDLCSRLNPDPPNDKCEQAESQLMTLLLNRCRSRVCDALEIDSRCADHRTVGESVSHSDALLCDPARTRDMCTHAQCESEEINSGEALELNTLTVELGSDGSIHLNWRQPFSETGSPTKYHVWRRPSMNVPFALIGETTALSYVDAAAATGDYYYEVTAVW